MYIYMYVYNINICRFTNKYCSPTIHPQSRDSQGQETLLLAFFAGNETHNYDTKC